MFRTPIDERLAKIPLFAHLSRKQLADVGALATALDIDAGKQLIVEGQAGREFFLVADGEAEVRRGDEVIGTKGPGDFFGETALLLDQPRNASVVALTDMVVEVIDRRDFRALLDEFPDLYAPLLEATARQLAAQDEH
jgi:CRP-like cAMP-binding protein